MLLSCGVGEGSWESLGLYGDQTINPKGNQSWIFIRRTNAEAEAPIHWPPDEKSWLIRKDPDAGKDWRQEEETAEDKMVGWHHWFNGREFEQASGNGEGQGRLACCSPCGHKESDMTEWLNNTVTTAMLTNEATELQVSLSPPYPCLRSHCIWDSLFLLKFWFSQKSREL